jgi:hypothetical protein
MANRTRSAPWFDFVSYGRMGRSERPNLTAVHIEHIRRTIGRSPEVMIKALSKGATTTRAVATHVDYVGRKGELAIETDDGRMLQEDGVGESLAADWALDMESEARALEPRAQQRAARLIHKLVFSMPPGTAPDSVLRATRAFCREEFALKHRYAMALHTDEPHPHVHVFVKAMSESGQRLDIRKSTLRAWRESFAEQLRELGVPAHASSRQVRGVSTPRLSDGRYRSLQRGASTVAQGTSAKPNPAAAMDRRERSRSLVVGWTAIGDQLDQQGHYQLAHDVLRFARRLGDSRTRYFTGATLDLASAQVAPPDKMLERHPVR